MTDPDPPPVDELVYEFLERIEDGQGPPSSVLRSLCDAWPSRAAELQRAVSRLADTGMMTTTGVESSELLGPFRIGRRLGGGGMGVVHMAWRDEDPHPVALKLLRVDQLAEPGTRERFEREIDAASSLDHPNIVRVLDRGVLSAPSRGEPERPYVALEWHRGGTLDHVIRACSASPAKSLTGADLLAAFDVEADPLELPTTLRGPWWEVVVRVAREVARALAHAHSRGVVHRDVKPSNVLVTPQGRVLLLDFGLASLRGSGRLTATGVQLGSLPYMSPEQVRGESVADERTDVYSLAVTTFELLTRRLPFRASDPERLGLAILSGGPPPLARQAPDVPPEFAAGLDAVLHCAMDVDPRARYASAEAFAADLTALLHGRSIVARPPTTLTRTVRWVRRRPFVAATAALATLLVLGAPLGYGILSRKHSSAMELTVDSALSHLASLVEAVDGGMRELADGPLYGDPLLFEARRRSVEHALSILEEAERDSEQYLGLDHPRAAALADQLASARGQLMGSRGSVHYDLFEIEEAVRDHAEEERIFRELAARHPGRVDYRLDLAQAVGNRCRSLVRAGRHDDVVEAIPTVLAIYDDLGADGHDGALLRRSVAASRLILGTSLAKLGRTNEAVDAIDAAIVRLDENVSGGVATSSDHRLLAEAYVQKTWAGGMLQSSHRLALLRRARVAIDAALGGSPRDVHTRALDAEIEVKAAIALAEMGEYEEARTRSARGLEVYREILAERPGVPKIADLEAAARDADGYISVLAGEVHAGLGIMRRELATERAELDARPDSAAARLSVVVRATNLANRLAVTTELGPRRLDEAIQLTTESLSLLDRDEALEPSIQRNVARRISLYTRGIARAMSGDISGSREDVDQLTEVIDPTNAQDLRFVADAHNECYLALERIGAGAEDVDAARESMYVFLERAIGAGYDDLNELSSTPALAPFRQDERFSRLLEGLR